jgi:hypothetical protein
MLSLIQAQAKCFGDGAGGAELEEGETNPRSTLDVPGCSLVTEVVNGRLMLTLLERCERHSLSG